MSPAPPAWPGRRALLVVPALVLGLLAASCGGGEDPVLGTDTPPPTATECPTLTPGGSGSADPTATEASTEAPTVTEGCPTAEPTATSVPTPTPVPTPAERSPITGLPIPEQSTTRIMTVKVDNHPNARPQTGIQHADMMIEIWVEGITRFLSVWQDSDTDVIGPIRSMRPTDFSIQNAWSSLFINSGGQGWVQAIGNRSNVQWYVEPAGTFRSSDRRAPHNLYGNTEALRSLNTRGDYDAPLEPLWNFAPMPPDAEVAEKVVTTWSNGFFSSWDWNGETYEKSTKGEPHMYYDEDGEEQQVTTDTIIVLEMTITSQSGGSGTKAVPVTQTTGSGPAWVFADGKMVTGTWARDTDQEWFTLTDDGGSEMPVPPGRPWLILAKAGGVSVE